MAFVAAQGATVVDQTTLMKKYLQFVAALTDVNTPDETKLKMMQEVSENFENVTSSPQYSTFLEHIIPRFLTFLQDGEVQFLQEKPAQQLRKLVLEIIHRIPTNEHLRPHTKNVLSVMFRFLETENEENVLICLRIIIELHKQFRPPITQEIHHFLDFVKQIYKELPKVVNRYFENPQVIPENTVPPPEMVGMITTIAVKVNPEREDSETRTHSIIPRGSLSLKVLAELPIIVVLMYQLYKLNIHNVVAEFVPLIMNTIAIQVSAQARQHKLYNKELYADFIAAQIKTLSFLAYIIRIYQELVTKYSQQMVKGMLQLLSNCPAETAHLRKELLIAAKHILTTELRNQFIPCMDKLFDESILIGSGYTARETLRPLAYSTLADLVHHVRQHLPLSDLSLAVQLFAKNIDDESLPSSIQTMSCKLLLNLVDCIRSKSEQESGNGRDVLMRMLEVFVLKFHTIARYQLSAIFKKCKPQSELGAVEAALPGVPAAPAAPGPAPSPAPVPTPAPPPPPPTTPATPVTPAPVPPFEKQGEKDKEDKQTFQVTDCRSLVKTLVCGVKTITWGITSCKAPGEAQFIPNKQLQPKETQIYIKLVKYAMQALDIYQVQIAGNGQTYIRVANCQTVRMKEEKEVLEHFAGVFTMMNPLTFKEIFQTTVPYMVERISKNYALQIVANSFLANPTTSALFATILVEYLLDRLPEMGSNVELSNLYLKLFKLVFGSVSLFAAENEQMLKPHLHKIVNSSMELAQTAKEPYNYFLLLRALFRSIGGGSHDLLYQEFLPLLPNLLQGLNMLQSGLHKQHMKDLFVELCLTVPVRLSSLLPYLPMLMDPLVSALNGSQTLVSQGLRTLELCVDNLQPDFLYDHIQPVRAELMQALWRTLRNPADSISHVAYRVLGKFGGSNRKMLKESQKLHYVVTEVQGPSITVEFSDCKASLQLPMEKAIETALDCLKSANTEPYYRRQAWEVIKCFLVAMMSLEDNKHALYQLLAHPNLLRPFLLPCYQVGSQPSTAMFHSEENGSKGMDPLVLIDAIAICMAYEEKELCKIGEVALAVIFDVASIILGSKERACQLPLFSYIVERLCACCYEQAWYAKLGGVVSIKFLMERLPLTWVLQNQQTFLKALLFVMMDLTGEVSNGAVAMAKTTLEQLLMRCATPLKDEERAEEIVAAQEKSFHHVTHDLVREVTSPNSTVRKQAMHSLQVLAQVTGKSVTVIMEPHKEVLQDMVPPKKHLLRHQPANAQIGLMEGNTFCTTLQPRLFTMDLNVVEHKVFYTELLNLCEAEDSALTKLPCYKSLPSLVPLRIAALNALAACNYLPQSREKIIAALFKALNSTNSELQEAGEACMRKFLEGATIEVDQIHTHMRPLLMMLGDYRSLTLNVVNRLTSVTRLFPNSFNDKFCDQMMQHLRKWMEVVVITHKGGQRSDGNEMKICSAIINLFHLIPAAPQTLVKPLLEVVMKTERAMLIEAGSPFREPLIKFLTRHPSQTVELFMMEATLNDPQWSRMFMSFLKHKDARPLRDVLAANPNRFITLLLPGGAQAAVRPGSPSTSTLRLDLQFQAIKIISIIVKNDDTWLANQHSLVSQLRRVWVSETFQERHRKENMAATNWKEPKLLAFCLLNYCKRNYGDIELLFQLLRAFTGRFLCNMTFLKEYMEEEIPKNYSITQKRALFFRFVDFNDPNFGDELKAKVLQHILNPAFLYSFEKGEGEQLLGPPNPEGDNPESITSVFITKVLDPEKQADMLDSLRIYLLQYATLLVEHAPHHIHDNNKNRNSKLRRLMTFAWPCLLSKACVDPACKYSGHLLLAHIIAKFAIHKKIVLQVFHSLLKAHAMEARAIVRQAMAILTPAVPARMEDGHQMLTHWTRKIIVEEGHTVPQLVHILHLIVQHFKVYYPVRHHLVQHMVSAMQRLGFTPSVTIEQRRLAVDLSEVVIKWELQRIKDQQPDSDMDPNSSGEGVNSVSSSIKRGLSVDSAQEVKRFRTATGAISAVFGRSQSLPGADSLLSKPIDKQHTDTVVNFLIRVACQVNDNTNTAGSPGEVLSRRCVTLLKTALRPDMWSKSELKLQWFDKLLMTVEQPNQVNYGNICTGLEVLSFLLSVLQSQAILSSFKPLQRGIAACMTCGNTKVLRAVHSLLSRLMSIFPTEPSTSSVASKYEELECLYAAVGKVIYEGLTNYEKATNANPSQLFGTLMILKSACSNNPSYIDRLISVFMRSLQKMVREHLNPQAASGSTEAAAGTSELVMLSLELVKTRLAVMSMEMRKNFIQAILTSLIEKSPDAKILRAVVKIVEEWVKNNSPMAANQTPTLREKSILLVKMMTYIEKRFPEDLELNAQFLDLVNYVYRDEALSGSELTAKLEPAFLSGLRCAQPLIRAKFFEVFDNSMKHRVYERLLYVTCSQNWEAMGNHFWIKQCIELLLAVCEKSTPIGTSCQGAMLPSITNVINLADSHDRAAFAMVTHVKQEPRERENSESKEEDVEIDIELAPGDQTSTPKTKELSEKDIGNQLHMLTNRHDKFLDTLREVKKTKMCSKELNQWEALTEYGQSKGHINPYLVLECAWRVSNWTAMKEALVQVEVSCPKEMAWKVNMYRGYLAICHPEEQQLSFIERLVEMASSLAIREWRRLPHVVSHVHTPLLQAAQQIIELQEAAQINAGLQPTNLGRNNSLHDMKTVVKTWRNRLPIVSDDLSHWSSIFMWRQHHYQAIVTAYENSSQHDPSSNNAMLGVHASASAIIQYGKIARKQGLVNVALDILSRIHTIPTVPIVDCFQKIRQQVKCYLQLAGVMGKNECMQGLEVIESTNLKYFTKEMTAEFYALKGMFLAQINKSEEANKAFSAAVQMHDVLVKAWAMWGDYLENIFVKERQLHLGVSAITCYLHACRHQNESKSRKYLAKVLWLLSFDDDKNTLADAVDKYCIGVPPIQWLAWIPQLLTCLVGSEGKLLLNLISQVGRVYPQAVYFPIRTLYLTLKIEQRERYKSDSGQQQPSSVGNQSHSASDPGPIRATAPMWRCSRIMHMQRELHPTLLSSLEGIVDQMVWFRENWHEEVLRQLQQGLAKCYSVAFEKSGAVSDAKITPHTLNFVKKLVSTFGVGLENVSNVSTMFSSAASESLARRAQATAQDPVFQKLKSQFTTDFDFSVPGSMKLHNLISKLKKWIKILEAKTKQLPKFFLIEEKCRFLSNFSAQTAEVEIPGEFLMPKPTHYYIKIARFMPRVEIVQKHNTAARRLYIRGHNGKIYPYLVMNDACLTESRREERVLQLLRLLNPCLEKRKETTKRHLFFTVPRVVAVSPQMRLVEDNPSSLSLVEIYKQRCAKKGIEHDNPISRYYDRLATVQARGTQASHQVLRDILKEVQGNMVPRSMLKEWALHALPNATDYWTFRKMFTIQLALIGFAEFVLHLNRLNPEMLQIAQDTGKLNVAYFRFDINDATGDLDANRPVPFRLTPNISEFLTTIGVSGPLTASMIAVARCFAQPNFKVDGILKTVLRDEVIAWHKKTQEDTSSPLSAAGQPENMDGQQLVSLVQKAVTAIVTRLHNLAQFEGGESKVNTLVAAANSLDNLCRMDPAWHPWL
ncbi:PREDICTED: transformation/transcription domain-associated protein [Dipodomys ordii]|uniref:Transformation/transcription domain-associated protein n=1 Tax=Dipodomys ordii TaxID=10020 RepID=A0A1S3FS50_DIPOR|nr:PREDICTED: transformation/transcription domain-associated protein [Dipodomys ordii]